MDKINSVNSGNCFQKQPNELVLPEEAVYQKPSIEMLKKEKIVHEYVITSHLLVHLVHVQQKKM